MSDKKLIECRTERDALRTQVKELHQILGMPVNKSLARMQYKLKEMKASNKVLCMKLNEREESRAKLHEEIAPLRQALKTEQNRVIIFERWRKGVIAELKHLGHPLAPNEPVTEKLRNMAGIIKSEAEVVQNGIAFFKTYPELAKTDNCDAAVQYLRNGGIAFVKKGGESDVK